MLGIGFGGVGLRLVSALGLLVCVPFVKVAVLVVSREGLFLIHQVFVCEGDDSHSIFFVLHLPLPLSNSELEINYVLRLFAYSRFALKLAAYFSFPLGFEARLVALNHFKVFVEPLS